MGQELCQMAAGDVFPADQQRRWRIAFCQSDGEGSENISIGAKATRAELQA